MCSSVSRRQILIGTTSAAVAVSTASTQSSAVLPVLSGDVVNPGRVLRGYRIFAYRPLTVWVKVKIGRFQRFIRSDRYPALLALRDVPSYGAVDLLVTGQGNAMKVVNAIARPDAEDGQHWLRRIAEIDVRKVVS